ncbi:DNA polymerase eta [Ochlerotatus camptorhynchus]|uniref:DNA polymerase eta n=1 Tax=Ochlerotatus camptorhynchus TaxID=644619 RepID=UPI0031D03FE8
MSSKQFININNKYDRVVVLVDMDCFYCQVEEKLNPEIRGKPIAVVQYNPWQGGGIIAVNYPARAKGVTRHMRGDEAKQHCPDIVLPQVPQVRGKADISKYRDAGKEVAAVLQTFTPLLERASVDEAYLDITERVLARLRDMNEGKFHLLPDKLANTFAVGYDSVGEFVQKISGDLEGKICSQELDSEEDRVAYKKSDIKLLIGASIVNEIRAAVKEKTGYECSAGISHNKILAKLTAGFHKPNKQTILPLKCISKMYETLSIKKVKGLGSKLGDQVCEILKIQTMSELAKFSEKVLQNHFDERIGSWMYLMAKGIDLEAVTPKFNSKSIGCCKRFPGKNAISGIATLKHWLGELANEIQERLEKDMDENNRIAKQMTVSYAQQFGQNDVSSTRSVPLVGYNADRIAADALEAIKRNTDVFLKPDSSGALNNPIKFLGISSGKFEDNATGKKSGLKEMFSNIANKAKEGESSKEFEKVEPISAKKEPEKRDLKHFFREKDGPSEPKEVTCSVENQQQRVQNDPIKFIGKEMFSNIANKAKEGESSKEIEKIELFVAKKEEAQDGPSDPNEVTCATENQQQSVQTDSVESSPKKKPSQTMFIKSSNHNSAVEKVNECSSVLLHNISEDDPTIAALEAKLVEDLSEPYLYDTQPIEKVQVAKYACPQSPLKYGESILERPKDDENPGEKISKLTSLEVKSVESINQEVVKGPSSSSGPSVLDYRRTYAEFNRPLCLPEPIKKPCPECGNDVPENELQSHLDFHFALQLSQQQRDEFRTEIKTKFSSPAAAAVKSKPHQPASRQVTKTKVPSIDKFLATTTATNTSTEDAVTKCAECNKRIPTASMQEHLDYHAARKLQIELNKLEMQTVKLNAFGVNASNTGAGSSLKRKRPSTSDKSQPAKVNNLSSYFTKM